MSALTQESTASAGIPTAQPPLLDVDRAIASTYTQTLEQSLEPLKVTNEPLDYRLSTGRSEEGPQIIRRDVSSVTEGVSKIIFRGVVPPERVGDGIGEFEGVRKGASSDLDIIIWVTPSTEPALRGVVEDGRVWEVGAGVYEVGIGYQHDRGLEVSWTDQLTQRPIPIWLNPLIAAFCLQRVLKIVEVGTVPRQEETGPMDLSEERVSDIRTVW